MLVTDRYQPRLADRLPEGVPAYVVPHELIHALVGFPFHRGILACAERRPWPPVHEIVRDRNRRLTLVICPRLSDPENLGAIARIGDVFGIDAILAGPTCPDPFSRRVLRVSMGSILRIPVTVSNRLGEIVDKLGPRRPGGIASRRGRACRGAVRRSPRVPTGSAWSSARRIKGSSRSGSSRCRRKITIPMRAGAGSLNVAVAAGILIQSLTRHPPDDRSNDRRSLTGEASPAVDEPDWSRLRINCILSSTHRTVRPIREAISALV